MSEYDIDVATKIWMKRLSENCMDRVASGCRNSLGKGQCNIILCPRLRKAELQIIYKFRDYKYICKSCNKGIKNAYFDGMLCGSCYNQKCRLKEKT